MDFDMHVKLAIYEMIARSAGVPSSEEVAAAISRPVDHVESAFERLRQKRLLVLEPGSSSRIRMAPPFSGIETQHLTQIGGKQYFANCAWDAFGIAAALHSDADVFSTCGDCGEAIELAIRGGRPMIQNCGTLSAAGDGGNNGDSREAGESGNSRDAIVPGVPVAHFAVPAAKWWADIIHT